jgi:ATP-binding cassette, subfamily F, member 3
LIGKNGAGKSTLLRYLANYKLEGLTHLRILIVDQHVEGNDLSPMEWVLRADVERTSLLEDEARLNAFIHGAAEEPLPEDLVGVNLEVALQEVYERMDLIGLNSSEFRAKKILSGLGFTEGMMTRPTNSLSGGWAMRAALAAAIFVKPNLLLLDEPVRTARCFSSTSDDKYCI